MAGADAVLGCQGFRLCRGDIQPTTENWVRVGHETETARREAAGKAGIMSQGTRSSCGTDGVTWTEVKPANQTERAVGRDKGFAVYPGAMGSRGRDLSWGVT